MKRKILAFIITLVICFSNLAILKTDIIVQAESGESGENENYLNYSFLWDVLYNFSNVVHDDELWGSGDNVIRKGRAFGTNGDRWAANYTYEKMFYNFTMSDVHKVEIESISWKSNEWNDLWKYNYKVEALDFNLEIYGDGYPYSNKVPKNETFAAPSGLVNCILEIGDFGKMDYNNSFTNLSVISKDISTWPIPSINIDYLNVSLYPINDDFSFIGNSSYLTINGDIPEIQELNVFLIDEEDGCEEIIENITNASAILLLQNSTIGNESYTANTSDLSGKPLFRAYYLENNNNLSAVIDLLKNDMFTIAEYFSDTGIIAFSYNYSQLCLSNDCFIVTPSGSIAKNTYILALWNMIPFVKNYRGLIMYDDFNETHECILTNRNWAGWETTEDEQEEWRNGSRFPGIQVFCVNRSVGKWLEENCNEENTSVTGYFEQVDNNVLAYNVWGNVTIPESPNDDIVIVSNRLDGWWGETPGDSGVGGAIALGILKYITDYDITPKYNLTFLFTTGEEYGFRGAWHFNHTHPNDNIKRFIGFDQLAFDQEGALTEILVRDNSTTGDIIRAIVEVSGYTSETGYEAPVRNASEQGVSGVTDCMVFRTRDDCDTITLSKDGYPWYNHHRAGMDFSDGDSLNNIDPVDVNMTYNLSWDIVKYFCVNPDCWFNNVTFEVFDSPNDGDTLNDSIRANFTMNTVLPLDYVTLEVLYNVTNGSSSSEIVYTTVNYTINSSGRSESIVFSIPDNSSQGNYSLILRLYNSTGCINILAGVGTNNYNDSINSSIYHLYHPFGYIKKGESYQNINNRITGSVFTVNENAYADNITAYINKLFMSPDLYKCMLYRLNDSTLIGNTSENWTNRDNEDPPLSDGWAVFNFSEPKPALIKDTQYVITCWGGDTYSRLYYDNSTYPLGRYDNETYDGTPPDPASFTNESRLYSIYCSYTPDYKGPDITSINSNPNPVGYGINITISADVTDISGVDTVEVYIFKPQNETLPGSSYSMTNTEGDTYEYVYNDTWLNGQYNYSIWAIDNFGNSNTSSQYSFNVSAMATVTVCTIQDEYGNNTFVNVTDPPEDPLSIGYELLDDGKVLRIWNKFDSYYFNTSSGIQLTNHYNEYWSHNVLMLGYYNNDQWNLIYRTDELSGFNKNIESDNETYVNATLWKDLTYLGYDFRLAIRYHLGVDDKELTVIPYIKNLGQAIPYNLGFAWELKDIQVDMTPSGDYIEINGTSYYLNQSLDKTYTNLDQPCFYIREDISSDRSESLYLCWNDSLDYLVRVKSREGQYNAPVTLGIKIGTLAAGQEKYTSLFWHDASEITYYFNSYNAGEAWAANPSYMVDGSTSTYATTTLDGDVELCNGNNCSGSNLGDILTVELRVFGYYSGSQYDIILRPIFGGTNDGDNYCRGTNSTQSWSEWYDITYDPGRESMSEWSWDEVKDLDCDVEADGNPFYPIFTLYCSKIEIRVTYIPNNNPIISDPVPTDGSTGISIAPVLNITVVDPDGDNMNITWLSNSSGSWVAFGFNNSIGNGTYHQTMVNASVNGQWWYWKVNVTDGTVSVESSVYKFYTGNESKIKNTGSTNISGYLLMQVQFFDGYNWVVVDNCPNETTPRTILVGEQFGLDTVFNGKINTADLIGDFGTGLYRVYACFRDPDGNVLVCDDDSLMEATYEFTINL